MNARCALWYLPSAHKLHAFEPLTAAYEPKPQGLHSAWPVPELYVPGPQGSQVLAPACEKCVINQNKENKRTLAWNSPWPQGKQPVEPVLLPNVPGAQAVHRILSVAELV